MCSRCKGLFKLCSYQPSDAKKIPYVQILEERISQLENRIEIVESKRAKLLSHELLRIIGDGEQQAAALQAERLFLPMYLSDPSEQSPDGAIIRGIVTRTYLLEGYGSVVPRRVVDEHLSRWDIDSEMEPELLDSL